MLSVLQAAGGETLAQEPAAVSGATAPAQHTKSHKPGWFGAEIKDLTAEERSAAGAIAGSGIRVVLPLVEGPAEKAGVRAGDILLSLDGERVTDAAGFIAAMAARPPGKIVPVELLRDGALVSVTVALGGRPAPGRPSEPIAARFFDLVQKSLETDDREQRIAPIEEALQLLSKIENWPLKGERGLVVADMWRRLGDSYKWRKTGDKEANLRTAIAGYRAALETATKNDAKWWGTMVFSLANCHEQLANMSHLLAEREEHQEAAIVALESALTVFTREQNPKDWAHVQSSLSLDYTYRVRGQMADNIEKAILHRRAQIEVQPSAPGPRRANDLAVLAELYLRRIRGSREENMETVIELYERSLAETPRELFPVEWAETLNALAHGYQRRLAGSRSDNIERAIELVSKSLAVRTREERPLDWADSQRRLGELHEERIVGLTADNVETAIRHFETATLAIPRATHSIKWAWAKSYLAAAYKNRLRGSRSQNVETSIKIYEEAIAAVSADGHPEAWASFSHNLANAYLRRIEGTQSANIEKAIELYGAAARTAKAANRMDHWAETQNSLGSAYARRKTGDRTENAESSIAAYKAALTVRTKEATPLDWATTNINLAQSYHNRIAGDRSENIEMAIAHYDAALTVLTSELHPSLWAGAQNNRSGAYYARVLGDKEANRHAAIEGLRAALSIKTMEAFPSDHLRSSAHLGEQLLVTGDFKGAAPHLASAREAFLQLMAETSNDADTQELIAEAGPAFRASAFAAAQSGDAAPALAHLNEGKSRTLALALGMHVLEVPQSDRTRQASLQADARDLAALADRTKGEDGRRVLERLADVRRQLRMIVGTPAAWSSQDAAERVGAFLPRGGALVAPIVTAAGGKLLLGIREESGVTRLKVVDLPKLTTDAVTAVVRGPGLWAEMNPKGWLGAFNLQYLKGPERATRLPEWYAKIDGIGYELWGMIGDAIANGLAEQGVQPGARLVWMPAGSLGLLPIGLAQDPATGRLLGSTWEIVHAPSLDAMAAAQRRVEKSAPSTLASIVNPSGEDSRLDLPFTEVEGAFVATYFGAESQTQFDKSNSDPMSVLRALKHHTYWHFSSHASFDWSDARQSGLLMRGAQKLTVANLLDAGASVGQPRLVVLSACETGLFDIDRNPDEFVGLPATFMQLGAAGVVSTLWQVDDLATSLLMARFYELHLGEGVAPPAALSRAQGWLRHATRADLIAYSKTAAAKARLAPRYLAALEQQLRSRTVDEEGESSESRGLSWKLLQDKVEAAAQAAAKALAKIWTDDESLKVRPFEHPFYWGGFVYTGL